jgi:hypothetical protein
MTLDTVTYEDAIRLLSFHAHLAPTAQAMTSLCKTVATVLT